nr:hypothetical protein [Leptothoe kymatousa]
MISSSIAYDVCCRPINPDASEKKRVFVGRVMVGLTLVIAGSLG